MDSFLCDTFRNIIGRVQLSYSTKPRFKVKPRSTEEVCSDHLYSKENLNKANDMRLKSYHSKSQKP